LLAKSSEVFVSKRQANNLLKINSFKLIFKGEVKAMKDYDVIVISSRTGAIIVEKNSGKNKRVIFWRINIERE